MSRRDNGGTVITIDGRSVALCGAKVTGYESFMFRNGYSAVPKDDVDSVTKTGSY